MTLQEHLKDNPCRGIALGVNEKGHYIQLAWIMGRSENSQNRIYRSVEDGFKTAPFDASKVTSARNIIYTAMCRAYGAHIVGNGDQTETVYDAFARSGISSDIFRGSLESRHCEDDFPNFTPRITGFQRYGIGDVDLSVLSADPKSKDLWCNVAESLPQDDVDSFLAEMKELTGLDREAFPSVRRHFELPVNYGQGYCVTTYNPGSASLPSFDRDPIEMSMTGSLDSIMWNVWNMLEPEWRVGLVGKAILPNGEVICASPINRHLSDSYKV